MEAAARDIHKAVGCQAVLVKGGHLLEGADQGQGQGLVVTDVLFDGHTTHRLESHVVVTGNTHGTGEGA
jgi:hydroxymethylpyrimidine/phosphomethylpyrimidine kinase